MVLNIYRNMKRQKVQKKSEVMHSMYLMHQLLCSFHQSYEIKSPPWIILWFRILGIFSIENINKFCVFMFQTLDNSQLLRRVL